MELSWIVLRQTLVMALYMLVGYLLFRGKKLDESGSRSIASLLVWGVIPCTIVKSCLVPYTTERLVQFAQSFALGVFSVSFAMLIAWLLFRTNPVERFAASFSNAGFIGIPLVQACLGDEAVFFLVGTIIFLNLMQWCFGVGWLKGEKSKPNARQLLLNPISLASLAAVLLFVSGLGQRLPTVVTTAIGGFAALNSPLAMLVLGVYLAQANPLDLVCKPRLFWLSFVRLLLIPALTCLVLSLIPLDNTIRLTVMIASAAPAGANVAVYSQLHDGDYPYACLTVTQSTILSILTLPLILALAGTLI